MKKEQFRTVEFNESLVDDLTISDEDQQGIPILFPNPEIRKMLRLANVNEKDIFLDLGCGWGQNLIIALTEFNVKKAIGIENNSERNKIAKRRFERLENVGIFRKRFEIIDADFELDFLNNKVNEFNIKDATCIFYGLSTSKALLNKIEKRITKGTRLICYYNCLFPEIMPDKNGIDFPFFVYTFPFKKTTSELKWLQTIVNKEHSILNSKSKPNISELWDELHHDYDVDGDPEDVTDYKKRIKKILKS